MWTGTALKLKKHQPKRPVEDSDPDVSAALQQSLLEEESETEDDPSDPGNKVLYFTDTDYAQRVPPPKYQQVKAIENMAMAAQKANKNLKVHVVCAGVLYGNGEQ